MQTSCTCSKLDKGVPKCLKLEKHMKKAPYKNAIRSKQLIRQATIALLDKKGSYDEITVSDICHEADINRGTFYNHYGNPIEVLEEIKEELMNRLTTTLKQNAGKKDINALVDTAIEHIQKNDTEYRKIVKIIPLSVIDKLKQELITHISAFRFDIDEMTLYLIVNGISGLYFDFLKGSLNLSYEKLAQITKQFIKKNIQ